MTGFTNSGPGAPEPRQHSFQPDALAYREQNRKHPESGWCPGPNCMRCARAEAESVKGQGEPFRGSLARAMGADQLEDRHRLDRGARAAYDEFTGHKGSYARQSEGVKQIWREIVQAATEAMRVSQAHPREREK